MKRIILAGAFLLGLLGLAGGAHACNNPNPNLVAPPFVDGCDLPASALNKLGAANGISIVNYLPPGQPDGTTDNSTSLNNAVTAQCAKGGGYIYLPANTNKYRFKDVTISCPITIFGAGQGASIIDYTGASAVGIQWMVTNFPAYTSSQHGQGGGIEDVGFTVTGGSATALKDLGFDYWHADRLTLTNAYDGFLVKGIIGSHFDNITMNGTFHTNYHFLGDLTGKQANGSPCAVSVSDCSTRTDFVAMHNLLNIDNRLTNTGIWIEGFVASIMGDHFAFEGAAIGMNITCPAGLDPNMAQCPQFIFLNDFQAEFFHQYGIFASDFIDMRLRGPYLYGDNTTTNDNDLRLSSINYTASTSPVGKVQISQGSFFTTRNDCIATVGTMYDVNIRDSYISGCNQANGGWSGIDLAASSGSLKQFNITGNTFCNVDAYAGGIVTAAGVLANSGAVIGVVNNNTFQNCGTRWTNNSAQPYTIREVGNTGPGTIPSLGACGGAGAGLTGSDEKFMVSIGGGVVHTCTVNFSSGFVKSPVCNVTPTTANAANFVYLDGNGSTAVLHDNGTAGLAGSYEVSCQWN